MLLNMICNAFNYSLYDALPQTLIVNRSEIDDEPLTFNRQ